MRQKIRRILIFISLFLFPVTLNFFSPYVSVDGAFSGLITGSVIVFFIMFLSGIILGRSWCGWLCPIAGLSEISNSINNKPVSLKKLAIIRYLIFAIWFGVLIIGFIVAGGIKGIDTLHLTENIISVDEPMKYIIYYMVLFIFFIITIVIGKRGACHSICWMSPFMVGGYLFGKALKLPQLRIVAEADKCIDCKRCNQKCPMSIDIAMEVKNGGINSLDCILCCECSDVCSKNILKPMITKKTM